MSSYQRAKPGLSPPVEKMTVDEMTLEKMTASAIYCQL